MKANKTTTEKIIEGLKSAEAELEKIRLQVSLGKAEAKDEYEEIKKKFQGYIQEAKIHIDEIKSGAKEIKPLLETLQLQFALGKAETKDMLEEQRKKISKSIAELETLFRKK